MNEKYVIVYGTLTSCGSNHRRFNFHKDTKFLRRLQLKGFKLYQTEYLPFVIKTDKDQDTIICELYLYRNENIADSIRRMELNAGYKEIEVDVEFNNDSIKAFMYVFDQVVENAIEIPSGMWMKYI